MAKEKEVLLLNIRKDENSASRTFGMYFSEVEYKGLLSTRALSEHIASHGKIWTADLVEGVLKQLKICIPEKVCQGYGIKLDGIGTFYPTIKSRKGGSEGRSDIKANGIKSLVEGVRIRFTPEQTELDNLTAKQFKEHCAFQMNDAVRTIYEGSGQNKKKVATLHMEFGDWVAQGCPTLTLENAGPVEP